MDVHLHRTETWGLLYGHGGANNALLQLGPGDAGCFLEGFTVNY